MSSVGSSPKQLFEEVNGIEEEEKNYLNVLKGFWREVFDFFGSYS